MKRISKPFLGVTAALAGGIAFLAAMQWSSSGRDTFPPPRINVQNTPINRDERVTSFAPVIKRAAPSVVNIYSTRTVRMRRMPMMPFMEDPRFRQYFGEDPDELSQVPP